MAYTAGTYSATDLPHILKKQQDLLNGQGRMSELEEPIVAGQAILSNMNPDISGIEFRGEECIKAKATNIRAASTITGSKSVTCIPTGGIEAGTDSKTFSKEVLTNIARFKIWDHECHNQYSFNDRFAYLDMKAKIDLEKELTKVLINFLATNADVPVPSWFKSTSVTPVVDDTNVLEIATADWKGDLLADFYAIKQLAYMPNAIILSGRNLWNATMLAQFQVNYASTNNQVLTGQNWFQMYFDLMNVDQVLGDSSTFMMDKNAIIFWSSPLHPQLVNPVLMASDTYMWSDTLPRLRYMANGAMQPIYVDIKTARGCTSGSYWTEYEYILRGALGTNLPNHNDDYGILRFRNVATPANE